MFLPGFCSFRRDGLRLARRRRGVALESVEVVSRSSDYFCSFFFRGRDRTCSYCIHIFLAVCSVLNGWNEKKSDGIYFFAVWGLCRGLFKKTEASQEQPRLCRQDTNADEIVSN